ncbi:MAG: MerR family transcriptional regulator [Faecousia sp.]
MQIKEVSNRTGLTIKTIRFYEERGLISPKIEWRNGKNYRDYQERDIEQLHMVAVLRKCLFSIDQIKTMLDHPELTQDVFLEYREALFNQRELPNLLADKAETVDVKTLKDPETLARRLTTTANPLPLPKMDVSPNFGRFDPETREERQAAYLQWQKRYKYRNLRWIVPLGLTLLALVVITVLYTNFVLKSNLTCFELVAKQMNLAGFGTFQRDYSDNERSDLRDVLANMTYGVYDSEGQLLPLANRAELTGTISKGSVPALASDAFARNFPWSINEGSRLRNEMEEYVSSYGTNRSNVHISPFQQTIVSSVDVTVQAVPYTLVLYFHASPAVMAVKKLMLVYLLVVVIWGIVIAVKTTKGYGFKVQFLRSYDFFGNRWNNAILSVDENNDNATLLTQQYSGMSNLVSMDYKKDE